MGVGRLGAPPLCCSTSKISVESVKRLLAEVVLLVRNSKRAAGAAGTPATRHTGISPLVEGGGVGIARFL